MADADRLAGILSTGSAPLRLSAGVAVGNVIGNNTTKTRRVCVEGIAKLTIRAKGTTVAGSPKLDIKGILSDGTGEDGTGTQAATGNATQVTLTASEVLASFTTNGEDYVDVIITCGAGDTYTVVYVDAFATPIYG